MRVFWERAGLLGPTYRLIGRGWSDSDVVNTLNVDETRVQSCISWMLRFLRFTTWAELVLHACPAPLGAWPTGLPSKNVGA
jgi:hypothetical protein